jgi:hypothetical protein
LPSASPRPCSRNDVMAPTRCASSGVGRPRPGAANSVHHRSRGTSVARPCCPYQSMPGSPARPARAMLIKSRVGRESMLVRARLTVRAIDGWLVFADIAPAPIGADRLAGLKRRIRRRGRRSARRVHRVTTTSMPRGAGAR